jgi:antitoxin component YwqK of YwqJK toxin-antitoxin module
MSRPFVEGNPLKVKRSLKMKALLSLCFLLATQLLLAQRTDTLRVKNGQYGVFQRDDRGKPVNPIAYYDSNGVLLYHASYLKNKLDGPVIFFDTLGRKTRLVEYRKGQKHGSEVFYYPDGSAWWRKSNRKGQTDGPSETFHPNGKIEWTKAYRKGALFGERILRDSSGALVNGDYTTVFPMSGGYYTTTCTNGRPHGKLTVFRANGEVGYTGNYNKGFPEGEFIYYDGKGDIVRREFYKNGKAEWVVGIGIE